MTTLQKYWSYLAVALAATAFACVKGEQSAQQADSTARNLTLAPTESSGAMKDVPAAQPRQPEKKATTPAPKTPAPKPAAPTTLTLAAGTRVGLTASDSISPPSAPSRAGSWARTRRAQWSAGPPARPPARSPRASRGTSTW